MTDKPEAAEANMSNAHERVTLAIAPILVALYSGGPHIRWMLLGMVHGVMLHEKDVDALTVAEFHASAFARRP